MKRRQPGNANPVTLGIIFTLVRGAFFFLFALPPLQYSSTSKRLPTVPGTIARSEVDVWQREGKMHYQADIVLKMYFIQPDQDELDIHFLANTVKQNMKNKNYYESQCY